MAANTGTGGGFMGNTVDGMIERLHAFEAMSKDERRQYIREATTGAGRTKLSDDDYTMLMAADGYFQNDSGEYD